MEILAALVVAAIGGLYVMATKHSDYYRGASSVLKPVGLGAACGLLGFQFGIAAQRWGKIPPDALDAIMPAAATCGALAIAAYLFDDFAKPNT